MFLSPFTLLSQTDTIFMNETKIACSVIEINSLEIKFSYIDESLINVMNRNSIDKIVFKSGRIQEFRKSYDPINSIKDYNRVEITFTEDAIRGCNNLGQITSKAKGATAWANMKKVQDRAYRKLKIYATMLGGDIIYLANENIIGNQGGSKYSSGTKTSTNLSGICYSRKSLNIDNFKEIIGSKTNYFVSNIISLAANGYNYQSKETRDSILINDIYLDGKYIVVDCLLDESVKNTKGEVSVNKINRKLKLIRYNSESFTLMWENRSKIYNATILLTEE